MDKYTFDPSKEILLRENPNKYSLFPINFPLLWDLYEKSLASMWFPSEIDFSQDIKDFQVLSKDEQFFIKNILGFFATSDSIINENLILNFYNEIQIPEARQVYATQIQIEAIHAHTYALMIENIVKNPREKLDLFNAITVNPIIQKKANWALKWISNGTFPERLLAFACVEGIFFSGSFCAIFWLKSKNKMPGLSLSNQFISRDESLHCETGVLLYNMLEQKLPESRVHEIFTEVFEIENEFINKSLPVELIGMNSVLMNQYIKYVVDYWLTKLNYKKLFNVTNPFTFMEHISLENKTNFFEKRVSEYQKANVYSHNTDNFNMNEDF